MKITPAAIRSQSFETSFRGFEKKEVTAFLDEVSQVVEQLNQENLELKSSDPKYAIDYGKTEGCGGFTF